MTVLLKECRDIQLRCGSTGLDSINDGTIVVGINAESDTEKVISERLVSLSLILSSARFRTCVLYFVEVIDVTFG